MELREVRTFLEVAECESFSRAAERLDYSQSAVTMQVKRLERQLGVRLFDRMPNGAQLTERGKVLSFYAHELLGAADRAVRAMREPAGALAEVTGTLRMGSVESLSTAVLPDVLVGYHKRHPKVEVVVRTARADQLARWVREGELDLFLTMEHKLSEHGLFRVLLREEDIVFVASPELADELGTLRPERLKYVPLVLTERGESYRLDLERAAAEKDVALRPIVETGNTETLVHLAERGVGVAFLPRFAARASLEAGALAEVPMEGLGPIRMWSQLFVHQEKLVTRSIGAFVDLLRETMGS